jgi:hypothetical protein
MEGLNEKNDNSRLKSYLDSVLKVSEKKFNYDRKPDSNRIKWGRLIVNAVQAYGKLLELDELETMKEDIEKIKEKIGFNDKL